MIAFDITEIQIGGACGAQARNFLLHAIHAVTEMQASFVLVFDPNYSLRELPVGLSSSRLIPASRKYLGDLRCDWLIMASPFHARGTDLMTMVRKCSPQVKLATFVSDLRQPSLMSGGASRSSLLFQLGMNIAINSDVVLTSSAGCTKILRDKLGSSPRIVDIGHGVSDQYFRDAPDDPQVWKQIRRRAPHLRLGKYLFTSYSDESHVDILYLLEGYSRLPRELRADYPLLISGDLPLPTRRKYKERWDQITTRVDGEGGEVIFLSYISAEEVRALYGGCRAFVYARGDERFPLSLAEAIASKCAFAASQTTSISAMSLPSEALFELTNPAQIAEKLQLVCIDDEFRAHCANWADGARASFHWQTVRATFSSAVFGNAQDINVLYQTVSPAIGVVGALSPEESDLGEYNCAIYGELARRASVKWYAPDEAVPIGRPDILPLSNFRRTSHHYDKVLFILSDEPASAPVLARLQTTPGLVWLHDVALKRLALQRATLANAEDPWTYIKSLLEKYTIDPPTSIRSWQALQSLPYGFLRPFLSSASEVIVHSQHEKNLAVADLGGISAYRAIHVLPRAIPTPSDGSRRASDATMKAVNIGVMCDESFMAVAADAITLFSASRKGVKVHVICPPVDQEDRGWARIYLVLTANKVSCEYVAPWSENGYHSSATAFDIVVQLTTVVSGRELKSVARAIGGGAAVISNAPVVSEMWGLMTLDAGAKTNALYVAGLLERAASVGYRKDLREIHATELPKYSVERVAEKLRYLLTA